tara:strand:+ start:1328 stop:2116 length:789 start_codon:yes stop_codon:yes gene_type:complete
MENNKKIINQLVSLAYKAGKEIMTLYQKSLEIELKKDNSPVTEADKLSDIIITSELAKNFPEIKCISEESYQKEEKGILGRNFFLIDPLDGTKEFIKKNDEFTVNIALVENNKSKLGIIYAPAKERLFFNIDKDKSYEIKTNILEEEINLNTSKKISVSKNKTDLTAVISRSHDNEMTRNFLKNYNIKNTIICGSSLKFCLIASGEADIYPRLGPTKEWDIAAGHAILEASGGKVITLDDKELIYGNKDQDYFNPEFIASNF